MRFSEGVSVDVYERKGGREGERERVDPLRLITSSLAFSCSACWFFMCSVLFDKSFLDACFAALLLGGS